MALLYRLALNFQSGQAVKSVRYCRNLGHASLRPNASMVEMGSIYAIETPAGTAGIAIRMTSGLRFYAAHDLYATLERERWQRIEDLYAAVNKLNAAENDAGSVGERLTARRSRPRS